MLLRDWVGAGPGDPIALWQHAERYLGVGTRTYSSFSGDLEIEDRYHPQLGAAAFALPTFRVPPPLGGYTTNAIPSTLHDMYRQESSILLPVHPNALDMPSLAGRSELLSCERGPDLTVVPSANARTVFVTHAGGEPVPVHFVKLHYPRRLSRFTRRLRRPVISLQLWVAEELWNASLPVVPELGGGYFGSSFAQSWGFLVRSADVPSWTVPLFALYGKDFTAPSDPPLLEQLVLGSGDDPLSYVADRVVVPMVRLWVRAALRTGCPLETHGQNTLFSFDSSYRDTRILYRDSAVYVDARLRSRLGLGGPLPPANVIPRDVPMAPEEVFSLTYDSFMGHHALSYVAGLLASRFGVPAAALHEAARAAFAEESGDVRLLPEGTFYYDDTLYDDDDWKLTDTGLPPTWR
jgi:hypothetical protein